MIDLLRTKYKFRYKLREELMMDYEEYQRLQSMLEERENDYFSEIALDRTKNLKDKDLLSHEEVLRKFRK